MCMLRLGSHCSDAGTSAIPASHLSHRQFILPSANHCGCEYNVNDTPQNGSQIAWVMRSPIGFHGWEHCPAPLCKSNEFSTAVRVQITHDVCICYSVNPGSEVYPKLTFQVDGCSSLQVLASDNSTFSPTFPAPPTTITSPFFLKAKVPKRNSYF